MASWCPESELSHVLVKKELLIQDRRPVLTLWLGGARGLEVTQIEETRMMG